MGATLVRARMYRVNADGADLRGANMTGAVLANGAFTDAQIDMATLIDADARWTNFKDAELSAANLSRGDFRDASFRDADLRGARLTRGRFEGADFGGADLDQTDIRGADLSGARGLTQAQVGRACGDASTLLPGRLIVPVCRAR
nr:pentapeptide repeat-containing protein [Brevundimonas lenta]